MIRKLRLKFILICMLMSGAVLLSVLALLIGSTVQQQNAQADSALTMALELRPDMDEIRRFPLPNDDLPPFDGFFRPRQEQLERMGSTLCVWLDENGGILDSAAMNLSLGEEDIAAMVQAALSQGKDEGFLPNADLAYRIAHDEHGMRIAFTDRSMDMQMLRSLIFSCAGVFVLAMLALFAASLYLSHWALRPVKKAWDRQRQFVADASHELKTPLTVILANTGLLLNNPDQTVDSQRRWVENTRDEGLRMKKLVDDLLFLAKADADRTKPDRVPMNLSDAVWSAVLPFESIAFERGQSLVTDIEPDLTVTADKPQVIQAVSILMDNACKYAPAGGSITVTLKKAQNRAQLIVHNTGEPIPSSALPHLFERFYRADASRARDAGGYGLGLSILQTLCRQNGCKVAVDSSAEKGTAFTLTFSL